MYNMNATLPILKGSKMTDQHVDPRTPFRAKTKQGVVSLKAVNNLTECVKRDVRDGVEPMDIDLWIDAVVSVLVSAERMDVLTANRVDTLLNTVIIPARDLVSRYRLDIGYWD